MSLLRKIARFLWRITIKIQEILLVLSSTFLALSICAMAFLRYVFQTDLFGLEEILLLLGMWLYFIGGAYGSFEKSQIKANVIEMLIKNKRILAVCDLAQSFLSTGLFLIASLYCIDFLDFSIMAGSKTPV
ncbi:MAG: TRAP transporter small permease subunit, partial [Clostridiales bacterium]